MSDLPPPPSYPPPPPPTQPPRQPPTTFLVSSEPTPARRSRGPVIALAVIGVAIIACLAVAVPMLVDEADRPPADLSAVETYADLSVDHTDADVDYPQSPPVGGEHAGQWLDCGVYDEPVREENAVHDLEHGTVWISYHPDLDGDDIEALSEALPQNGILAPYPDLRAPVVVTVWGAQLELEGADDPRLELFVARYGGGDTAPEPFASCAGGVRDPDGTGGPGGSGPGVDV